MPQTSHALTDSHTTPQRLEHHRALTTQPASNLQAVFDRAVAVLTLLLATPVLLLRALVAWSQTGRVFDRFPRLDHDGEEYMDRRFAGHGPAANLARLGHVVSGRLALVGPRPLSVIEHRRLSDTERQQRGLRRCGLVSLYSVRLRLGIAYESEVETDLQWIASDSFRKRPGLLLRAALAQVIGASSVEASSSSLDLLGIRIDNYRMNETVDRLVGLASSDRRHQIAFVNPDCLNIAQGNGAYRRALGRCRMVLPDGVGLQIAGRLLGHRWAGNINGTDLFPQLCEAARDRGLRLFLLGARPGVAAAVGREMTTRFPGLQVVGTRDGYFEPFETHRVVRTINRSGADILLVAMGAPRQELWLAENGPALSVPLQLGVGGLFDFYSGRIPRAPRVLQELGLEWAWRLLQEPGRLWRRYIIGNPLFLGRVLAQKLRGGLHPASGDAT